MVLMYTSFEKELTMGLPLGYLFWRLDLLIEYSLIIPQELQNYRSELSVMVPEEVDGMRFMLLMAFSAVGSLLRSFLTINSWCSWSSWRYGLMELLLACPVILIICCSPRPDFARLETAVARLE
ncbi:hypothetical protein NQ317_010876 [Molorchus minor]|uniref:Uncharacterized protein n=1 Tax=Molorchus minor TaxID=1323400 RepID=A0ABQ9JD93_9CUCU|nr:hypothetical protein NQ317_010876 [Molorchus minor]